MKRNLIYHITPMGNYRWNIYQLQKRLMLFDGKMFAAVAQGNNLAPIEQVRKLLPPKVHMFPVPNDRELRETATLLPLLNRLKAETDDDDITLYAHTKGVTHGNHPAVKLWTEALHFFNLDLLAQVEQLIEKQGGGAVGSLIRHGVFDHFPKASKWHYAGTFFWFHNGSLFSKPHWDQVPKMKYGAEAYPSLNFKLKKEAGALFGPSITDLYNYRYLDQIFGKSLINQIRSRCA